ncbi:hypothetical protein SO802_032515 [Lithocarpus litseifolius]|uniref:TTF-type domain-containing protein n=1 Tax=Lithocarpus litseifolius TaxID=425828 RepID=A0AAW2BDP7_9ROSI
MLGQAEVSSAHSYENLLVGIERILIHWLVCVGDLVLVLLALDWGIKQACLLSGVRVEGLMPDGHMGPAFCFYCYLFGQEVGKQGGDETFVMKRFKLWNQLVKLDSHVGGVNSAHNQAVKKSEDLLKEKQHIQSVLVKQSNQDKIEYRVQLNAIVDCIRFLLCRGLAFRGHDESQGSSDKGNFLELLQFLGDHNESINEVLQKAPKNCKLTHSNIQKDIVNAIARETSKAIIKGLDNGFFSILVDESRDISVKEQMTFVLRYVNKKGIIIEQFLGIVHVASTTALSLKYAIECLLCEHNLSLSNLREQGYDGASNMQGDISGLKTLILKENKSAFYVYCFAYQLQLTLVVVAKNHINIAELFYVISNLVAVVGGSCKRRDALRDAQFAKIKEDLENVIDMQLQELNNLFSKVNTDLLLCMACLNPSNSFVAFDKEKLIRLAKFYPSDFLGTDILALDSQLHNYIFDMRSNNLFLELQGVSELVEKLVYTRKHKTYPLVYLLVKLALTLLVATATVERSFSAMKYIKNELRNQMGDQWMNDCLIVYIEKDVACSIDNETITQRFQNMKTRRGQL